MLQSLDTLSGVAVTTIDQSKAQLLDNLRALAPTLTKLADAGSNLPTALKILPTYPLPDVAGDVVKGDYANVTARLDLDLDSILQNVENAGKIPGTTIPIPAPAAPPPLPLPGDSGTAALPPVVGQVTGQLGGLLGSLLGGGS
jgi:phospholipid/cholesterol/gamma-HCH transport system substrate-binding protein